MAQACCARRAAELQFYTSAAAVAMLVPAWVFFMVSGEQSPWHLAAFALSALGAE